MRFGSVCSGIEAASVAWNPLGWRAVWFSEIEPFPSAVLAHHYPDVPNLGDMSTLPERIRSGEVEAPDVFCGGTPCQAFSVAGLRHSLDDARGNLSLTFCEIANAIDAVRLSGGEQPAVVFWENVPGVLNTKDNAFGCFLAGLAGEDDPLVPPGKKWSNAGCVYGPARAIAWRVLDAQYFGVAQRRRRVFVVASARKGFDPAAVLFEFDGVRRDTAPSREAGQAVAAHAARSVALRGREGGATAELGDELAGCLRASGGGGDKPHALAPTLRAGGHAESHANAGVMPAIAFPANLSGTQHASTENLAPAMGAKNPTAVAFQERGRADGRSFEVGGDVAYALTAPNGGGRAQERNVLTPTMQVRRLTPRECERLQGFEDDTTLVPFGRVIRPEKLDLDFLKYQLRGNPKHLTREDAGRLAADSHRYKALGNSWAVPNVRWIGRRIADFLDAEISALI